MKYTLFAFLFITGYTIAQKPTVKHWDKRYGGTLEEQIKMFSPTPDGGYILGGRSKSDIGGDKTEDSRGNWDYWIVKTDSIGNKEWDKRFGGSDIEYFSKVLPTADGGYLLAGYTYSDSGGDKSQPRLNGYSDYWVVKTDSAGNKQWDKIYWGDEYDYLFDAIEVTGGGYLLGGTSRSDSSGNKTSHNHGGSDFWVVKIDTAGNILWNKNYGGNLNDQLVSIQQTTDGGFILGGSSESDINGDKTQPNWDVGLGSNDYWVVKTDSAGNKQWDKRFGSMHDEILGCVRQAPNGKYVLAGYTRSDIGGDKTHVLFDGNIFTGYDSWVVGIDSAGNKLWDQEAGGTSSEDEFTNVAVDNNCSWLIAGTSYSNISGNKTENNLGVEQSWMMKLDSLGNALWDKTIFTAGHEEISYAMPVETGCYIIVNSSAANPGGYKSDSARGQWNDYWMVKLCDSAHSTFALQAAATGTNAGCGNLCHGSATANGFFGMPPYTYLWQPVNDTAAAISNLCAGTYNVTVTDAAHAVVTATVIIDSAAIPHVNATATQTTFCATDSTHICSTPGFTGYLWNTGATGNCITTSLAGNYYVTVTDANGCSAESNHVAITVHQLPPVSISVNGDTLSAYGAVAYQWYLNDNIITGATDSVYVAGQAGNYSIAVTDTNGCIATSNAIVITGVDALSTQHSTFSISPNPFTDAINISTSTTGATIILTDITGRKVAEQKLSTQHSTLSTANLSCGGYFLQIIIDGERIVKQMVKQ